MSQPAVMATFPPLAYVLLLIALLAYVHADGVEVHIISSTPPSKCNCTLNARTTGHVICPHLSTALENCKSNETSNLTFILHNDDSFETFLSYEVSNTVHIQSNGPENAPYTIYCIDYSSLEFISSLDNHHSVLYFDNIEFFGCGNSVLIGINISCVYSVNMNQASFQYMLGLSILNAVDVDIRNSIFKDCYTNPYAVLQITYNNLRMSDADDDIYDTISLFNCHFESNRDVSDYSSIEGRSGVFVVSFPYLQDKTFVISLQECYFDSNDLQYFSYRSPMLYVLNSTNLSVQFTIKNSFFTNNNDLAVLFEMHGTEDLLSVRLFNNSFLNNNNLLSDYGLIHANINCKFVTLNYEQLYFLKNSGKLIYSSYNAIVDHIFNNCSFVDNTNGNSKDYIIAFHGSQDNLPNVTLNELKYKVGKPQVRSNVKSIFYFRSVNLVAKNLDLTGSDNVVATMFYLDMVNAVFNGNNTFYYNEGDHGGGLAMNGGNLTITKGSILTFSNNNAFYGGAMYINTTHFNTALICNGSINFSENHARLAGQSIYTTDTNISIDSFEKCFEVPLENIATAPVEFNATIVLSHHPFFPGQFIFLNIFLIDGLGNPGTCIAEVSLNCNTTKGDFVFCERLYPDLGLQLFGPSEVYLYGKGKIVNTLLRFGINFGVNKDITPQLHISCQDPLLPSNLTRELSFSWKNHCPLGFIKNSAIKVCQCNEKIYEIKCPFDSGVACIQSGYWTDTNITIKCSYPLCDSSHLQNTPETQICQQYYGQQVIALPQSADDQCSTNRGGRRCSRCRDGYNLTFLGKKCTKNCNTPLYPIIITLLTIAFQFMIALFILAAVRIKLEIGAGFIYGPLIFLAIIGQMPLGHYHSLKVIVSSITSVYLVNLEVFGEIPWCFGIPDTKLLLINSFYYLGPLLVWIILLLLVGMGRCCPRLLDKIQDSPMQAICLLMMLSFWSMTSTSIHMLRPLIIGTSWYTTEDPYVKYFEGDHIIFGLAAIAIICLAILPFISVLAMSNFELPSRIFRLHRFKPIFDEFQSCYLDKYRWYCIVYYISFILFLIVAQYPLGPQLLLVLLLSLHFVVQPYKKHILNIIDMLLLLDLLVLYSLLEREEELEDRKTFYAVLVHMMTLVPLLYVVVGSIGIFCLHCKHRLKIKSSSFSLRSIQWRTSQSQPSRSIMRTELIKDDDEGEREPLIGIIQADDKN